MAQPVNEKLILGGGIAIAASAGAGKVLTSDAGGTGTWQPPLGIGFDFRTNGTMYYTPGSALNLTTLSTLNGTGSGTAVITYTVGGVTKTLPFAVAAGQELAVTVASMTGVQRVSFTVQ